MKLTKSKLKEMIKEELQKLNEGGEKTYLSLMKVEKEINNLEKIFKKEQKGMVRDRARTVKK